MQTLEYDRYHNGQYSRVKSNKIEKKITLIRIRSPHLWYSVVPVFRPCRLHEVFMEVTAVLND